jgi:uncharacterized membrane protein YozB (DUF420 family)
VREGIADIVYMISNADWQQVIQEHIEKRRNKVREPFTWERVKYHFAMPILFVVMIPVFLMLMCLANVQVENDINSGVIAICLVVIVGLVVIVVWAMSESEKNLHRKFWMELMVALFMEALLVFHLYLFLDGYYYEHAHGAKRMMTAVYAMPFYLIYMEKSNRNWKALQDLKYSLPKEDAEGEV